MKNSFFFLLASIKSLGIKQGYAYWRIYRYAQKDPGFVERWAKSCEREAARLEFFNKDPEFSIASREWARTLRTYAVKSN